MGPVAEREDGRLLPRLPDDETSRPHGLPRCRACDILYAIEDLIIARIDGSLYENIRISNV